jgi:hypothetical protein
MAYDRQVQQPSKQGLIKDKKIPTYRQISYYLQLKQRRVDYYLDLKQRRLQKDTL